MSRLYMKPTCLKWAFVSTLTAGILMVAINCVCLAASPDQTSATLNQDDAKKVQESLRDKGYYSGPIDGVFGPKTRAAIRGYQKSENLQETGQLDNKTAGKLGVGPESSKGNFKGAGSEMKEGGEEAGHEVKQGKPVAAGKELGKGVGRASKKVGKGVKEAVDPESDRGDREEKQEKK